MIGLDKRRESVGHIREEPSQYQFEEALE